MLLPQEEKGRGVFRKAHRDGILWRARLLNHHKDGDREFCRAWSNLLQWEVFLPMEVNELQAPFQPKSFHGSAPYKQTSALLGVTPTRMLILQDQTAPDAKPPSKDQPAGETQLPSSSENIPSSQGRQREMRGDTSPAALVTCQPITSHRIPLRQCHLPSGCHSTGCNPTLRREEN